MNNKVTGEEVKTAMVAAGIERVDHHDCGCCGMMVYYHRENDQLFFNPACDCVWHYSPPEPRSWDEAADWINMQSDPKWNADLRARFGLTAAERSGS
jgi:hypothetical protein